MSRKVVIVAVVAVVVLVVLARRAAAARNRHMVYTGTPITSVTTANLRKAAIDAAMGRTRAPGPDYAQLYGVK